MVLPKVARNKQAQIDGQIRSIDIIKVDLERKKWASRRKSDFGRQRRPTGAGSVPRLKAKLFRLQAEQEQNLIEARDVKNQITQAQERFAEDATQETA